MHQRMPHMSLQFQLEMFKTASPVDSYMICFCFYTLGSFYYGVSDG